MRYTDKDKEFSEKNNRYTDKHYKCSNNVYLNNKIRWVIILLSIACMACGVSQGEQAVSISLPGESGEQAAGWSENGDAEQTAGWSEGGDAEQAMAQPDPEALSQVPQTMTIYDIEEGYLEVPYNPELEHHTYDFSRIIREEEYKYYLIDGEVRSAIGIDVSKYQGTIDWKKVKESGIEFAIIRVGFRGYGSGELKLDTQFKRNIKEATAAGIEVGVYFFSQAVTPEEAITEADFVLQAVAGYELSYPIVFDTEKIKNDTARTDDLTNEELTEITLSFCSRIEEMGYAPMIYANAKWLTTRLDLTQLQSYPIWYADYQEEPLYPYAFSIWQYTESGTVPGIGTNVDLNICFFEE